MSDSPFADKTALVWDQGLYVHVAEKLAETFGKVIYFCEWHTTFPIPNQHQINYKLNNIILDENPRNINTKMEVWQQFMPFLQIALKMSMFGVIAQIMEYAPFPASIVEELKKEMAQLQQAQQMQGGAPGGGRGKSNPQLDAAKIQKLQTASQVDISRARAIDAAAKLKGIAVGLDAASRASKMVAEHRGQSMDAAHRSQTMRHERQLHAPQLVDAYGQAIQSVRQAGEPRTE